MISIENKIKQVNDSFQNGDSHLGMRRLIDCVLDTDDTQVYRQFLKLIESAENDNNRSLNGTELSPLLETLSNFQYRVKVKTPENEVLLEAKDLSKTYAKSTFKISPINFTLKYGEVIGLVGENGNGKTTLLRLLSKDLFPDSGNIRYAAESQNKTLFELRSKLIYIPQRVPRWFGSLMDNLYFTLSNHGIYNEGNLLRAELIIARLGLRAYRHLGWNRISSGYRTRFELARSLLRKPELMLLDEPLSNLDIISQQTILQDLKFMSESFSHPFGLVLSSQQLYEVEKISDLVIFLKNGVPQYQRKDANETENTGELIFELDANADRELLLKVFSDCGIHSIHFNGGVYVLHFKAGSEQKQIFAGISKNDLQVNYIRNITHSSRRFFIQ